MIYNNLKQWFDNAKQDLIRTGLVTNEEVLNEKGETVSEVRFCKGAAHWIINMDETHHDFSVTGDRGGPRAVSYHNPSIQRGAARAVKSSRHVTGAYATNSAGEALPPFYIFDSSAKSSENFRVKVEWLEGLPSVTERFGCPTIVECGSFYAVRPRGSMDDTLLNDYIERVIVPLYPNMNKTAVFDPVTGKLNQGAVILMLDLEEELCHQRKFFPIDLVFCKEKILRSWAKVGFVPFTRNCLKDKKVRRELGQKDEDDRLKKLQHTYELLVDSIEEDGFNPGIFDTSILTAAHVNRAATEEEQVEELVRSGKAFFASGHWNMCDSRIGNAGVTIKAQKRQLELNEAARTKVVNKKTEAQSKMLEKAVIALAKFELNRHAMNDKDWGDVVQWALPAANVEFLLKNLKKKEDIITKLATLPNCWTTYIPRTPPLHEVAPTITATV